MKNRIRINVKVAGILCFLAMLFLAVSCQNGYDEDPSFSAGVSNTQLESPTIDETCFSTSTLSDGSEIVVLDWPVVMGAGGYQVSVYMISNPEDNTVSEDNPYALVTDSIIDGSSITFAKTEDAIYSISILTLGNSTLNNSQALAATVYTYSAVIEAVTIPTGTDIAEYIAANLVDSSNELGFALEAGGSYTMNGTVDFGLNTVTLRSTDQTAAHPVVVVGAEGGIVTQGGLKIKWIDFDCTDMETTGLLSFSSNPDASVLNKNTSKYSGASNNCYIIDNPVIFQQCMVKNLPNSLIYGNKVSWALTDFRITDCIIQMKNSGSNSFINLYGASAGCIKAFTLKNSTFYNTEENGSAYFYRYSNQSNAQPKKVFGENYNSATITFTNNTFVRTMTGKDFGNNYINTNNNNSFITIITDNIYYDVYRVYQSYGTQTTRTFANNTICCPTKGIQSNDTGRTDNNGNALCIADEDMAFENMDFTQELDFTKDNGGLNFTPTGGATTLELGNGDPRWLE